MTLHDSCKIPVQVTDASDKQQAGTLPLPWHMHMPSGLSLAAVQEAQVSLCSKFDIALKVFRSVSMGTMIAPQSVLQRCVADT